MKGFNEYQEATNRTAGQFDDKKTALIAWSMGISGESGEYTDGIKKHVFHGHELDTEGQAKELGDILFYVAQSAKELGYTLSEIAAMNIAKLQKRYPDGFSEGKSRNREE